MSGGQKLRQSRQFKIKRKFLIVGDGKTEEKYFDGLTCEDPDILIKSVSHGKSGMNVIITKTRNLMKTYGIDANNEDRVAIVTDLDFRYTPKQISESEEQCRKWGIELYVSNPCFEVWLLQHFKEYRKPSDPAELVQEMEKVLGKKYNKGERLDLERDQVTKAIRNAEKAFGRELDAIWCSENDPSTNVHMLVRELIRR